MYDTTRELYCWAHLVNDVYGYVEKCPDCSRPRQHLTFQRLLQQFPPEHPLEFIGMGIMGPLPRTKSSKLIVIIIAECYPKLIKAIPTKKTTASHIAEIVFEA